MYLEGFRESLWCNESRSHMGSVALVWYRRKRMNARKRFCNDSVVCGKIEKIFSVKDVWCFSGWLLSSLYGWNDDIRYCIMKTEPGHSKPCMRHILYCKQVKKTDTIPKTSIQEELNENAGRCVWRDGCVPELGSFSCLWCGQYIPSVLYPIPDISS